MDSYSFDLHLHSCLSPCADDDMTPADLAAMCALAGLDIVALTDHNTTGNCAPFSAAAARCGLLAIPGMELTTAEEVHVVCLFPDLDEAESFGALVQEHLPRVENRPEFWGRQLRMDDGDCVLGEETALLSGATDIPISAVHDLVSSHGGVAYPAHIDREAFSLLSNLGLWDAGLGFSLAEVSANCPPALLQRPDLKNVRCISASDAHTLAQVRDAFQQMSLPEKSVSAALRWFKK